MYRSLWCGQTKTFLNNCIHVKPKSHKEWNNVLGKFCCRQIQTKHVRVSPFSQFIEHRKSEAKRSLIVQVQSSQSYKELYAYCNQLGSINRMFHYTNGVEPLHFILIEFNNEADVVNILNSSCHIDDNQAVPVNSPFLWFKVSNKKSSLIKQSKNLKLELENGNKLPSDESITELIRSSDNISDQMRVLYELTRLNDLGVRLRFLTARQIELAMAGMFPDAIAYPFGSSINGYGKLGCDLDLILKLNRIKENPQSRLIYQCKAGLGNERSQSQRHMEAIGDILHLFLPGCSQVRRILQARVPILKYYQQFTDVECDLSMTNMTALHMSEILYLFGSIDDRVRPLVFTIRKWAQEVGLTNSSPGRWITNFSLTLLVLAFLQRTSTTSPILPALNTINPSTDATSCDYLSNQNITKHKTNNTDKLELLLFQFFEYYSNFDFTTKAISLNESSIITKPETSALYIVNPLERALNVSKNVSLEELERLKIELRNAAWALESQDNKKVGKWGILSIFTNNKTQKSFYIAQARNNRMMEVKKLFEDDEIEEEIEFKNEAVKQQVENIKLETVKQIQEIDKPKRRSLKRR